MAIQEWELGQYQYAAEQLCYRLNENPNDMGASRNEPPRWMLYAAKLHELKAMVEALRLAGIPL